MQSSLENEELVWQRGSPSKKFSTSRNLRSAIKEKEREIWKSGLCNNFALGKCRQRSSYSMTLILPPKFQQYVNVGLLWLHCHSLLVSSESIQIIPDSLSSNFAASESSDSQTSSHDDRAPASSSVWTPRSSPSDLHDILIRSDTQVPLFPQIELRGKLSTNTSDAVERMLQLLFMNMEGNIGGSHKVSIARAWSKWRWPMITLLTSLMEWVSFSIRLPRGRWPNSLGARYAGYDIADKLTEHMWKKQTELVTPRPGLVAAMWRFWWWAIGH